MCIEKEKQQEKNHVLDFAVGERDRGPVLFVHPRWHGERLDEDIKVRVVEFPGSNDGSNSVMVVMVLCELVMVVMELSELECAFSCGVMLVME